QSMHPPRPPREAAHSRAGRREGFTVQVQSSRLAVFPFEPLDPRPREVERLTDRRQHAEAEHVDLEEAERVEIVLVPGDHGSIAHRRRLHRRDVLERLGAEHEASHVNRQVTRASLQRVRHREHLANTDVLRIEAAGPDAIGVDLVELVPPRDERAESIDLLEGETEGLAHFAQSALAAVGYDLAHHRGAIATERAVDGLDDLFAPLMLEVEVDGRRLAPLGREEPLEEKVTKGGIVRRDAEAVADGAVRRAAAPLAEDVAVARHLDDGLNAQKIRRDFD